jgi:hypothetical protein
VGQAGEAMIYSKYTIILCLTYTAAVYTKSNAPGALLVSVDVQS